MQHIKSAILTLLFIHLCLGQIYAGDIYNSVTEFGAKGDGITDDTDAIQRAVDASNRSMHSNINIGGVYAGPIYVGNAKTVYIPAGMYKISRPIRISSYSSIKGDKAILFPDKKFQSSSNALIGTNCWLAHIEGIQFIGFDKALHLENNNLDNGKMEINNCDFLGNRIAIQVKGVSSYVYINNNRFNNNQKAAVIDAVQKADMSGNWITAGTLKGTHDAQILNNSTLHFDKNILVPVYPAAGSIEPAWINNFGSVYINGTRQGGEPGSFTLVNNFTPAVKNPFWPNSVVIRDTECYAVYGNEKGYKQPAALRLIEIPNNIVLENLVGFIDADVMGFSRKKDPSLQLRKIDPASASIMYRVKVQNIQGPQFNRPNGPALPESLLKYEVK